MGMVVELLKV